MTCHYLGAFCLLVLPALCLSATLISTNLGLTQGHTLSVNNGRVIRDIDIWYNIGYAQPPLADLRFKAPVVAEPWDDVYVADEVGNACMQIPVGTMTPTNPLLANYSEDCLNVNIYAPSEESGQPYPVMLWYHGGAYQQGANLQYPGHYLATYGVVVVTANYRLGNFGFAYTGDDACPGNAGLFDQKMALEFVVDNIRAFGGDPGRITVFGESAGASSTSLLVLSPLTKDLFQQAIMESGTEINPWSVNSPLSSPENYTRQLAIARDCPTSDSYEMMDCLRELPATSIRNFLAPCTEGYACLGMTPVVDGPGGFLPDWPRNLRQAGNIMKGPIITGICQEDAALFTGILIGGAIGDPDGFNRSKFVDAINAEISRYASRMSAQAFSEMRNALDYLYSPWPYLDDKQANRDAIVQLETDYLFGAPWDYLVKEQSKYAPSFAYVFEYTRNQSNVSDWRGAFHSCEINFLWGRPMMQLNPDVMEDAQLTFQPFVFTDEDIQYSIFIEEMFSNFAIYGDPTPGPLGVQNPLDNSWTKWEAFTWESMNYLYATSHPSMHQEYKQQNYAFYDDYLPYLTGWHSDGQPVNPLEPLQGPRASKPAPSSSAWTTLLKAV